MSVVVYSKPRCQPCRLTKTKLTELGIDFIEVDISTNDEARQEVIDLGYLGAPVVYVSPENHWSGYKLDKIKEVANQSMRV